MTLTQLLHSGSAAFSRIESVHLLIGLVACIGIGGRAGADAALPELALFAGNMGGTGNFDGTGIEARFNYPYGVATDSAGNIYVADSGLDAWPDRSSNNTIRKITPAGVVSTLAGLAGVSGSADGVGAVARFNFPRGVATDRAGNVYVVDTNNNTIRKITPAGVVSTLAGSAGVTGSSDGVGTAAQFNYPYGVATDRAGNVYVTDKNNSTIRKITPAGVVSTFAGTAGAHGSQNGVGAAARFFFPHGVTTDSADNVYVADKTTIRKITPAGVVSTFAGEADAYGSVDGVGAAARFGGLAGLATDSADNVYVVDSDTIRKITPAGVVSTLAGEARARGHADGVGAAASFNELRGVTTDSAGNVYAADSGNHAIRKITPAGVTSTFAGAARLRGLSDGTGAKARFLDPYGVATDREGNVYVADEDSIRKITPAGLVSTLDDGNWDNTNPADAASVRFRRFSRLYGVATDSAGNVYVADNLIRNLSSAGDGHGLGVLLTVFREKKYDTIRKITPSGMVNSLVGKSADLDYPHGLATDSAGNVYVADSDNHTIRKIIPRKIIHAGVRTCAGTAGDRGSADGVGATARFSNPQGVATDSAGNVYVADSDNHTIRKITPAGVVSTFAGTAGNRGKADGVGAAASFNSPRSMATDSKGNVYVADYNNQTIRKITPAGVVSTLVGKAGQIGFVAGALPGVLGYPKAVAVHGTSLYITAHNGVVVVKNLP